MISERTIHGDAELARREQAQHTPGPTPADKGIQAACNDALMAEAAQKIDELRGERDRARKLAVNIGTERDRLAADNERLRGLLADAYDELRWHYLSKAGDLGIPHERAMTMISEMPLMRRIKAAKEAAK